MASFDSADVLTSYENPMSIDPQLLDGSTASTADLIYMSSPEPDFQTFPFQPNEWHSTPSLFEDMQLPASYYQEQMLRHRRSLSQPPEDLSQAAPPMVFHREGQYLGPPTSQPLVSGVEDLRRRLLRDRQTQSRGRGRGAAASRGRARPYPDPKSSGRVTRQQAKMRHASAEPLTLPPDDQSEQYLVPEQDPLPPSINALSMLSKSNDFRTLLAKLALISRSAAEVSTSLTQLIRATPPVSAELEAQRNEKRALNAAVIDTEEMLIRLPLSLDEALSVDVPDTGREVKSLDETGLDALMDAYSIPRTEEMAGCEKRVAWLRFVGAGKELIDGIIGRA